MLWDTLYNKCEFLRPFSIVILFFRSCFALDQLDWKQKSLLTMPSNDLLLHIKQKFSMVKLIPWNLVDLSHLYYYHIWTESFYLHWKDMMSTFVEVIRREMMNEKKERKVVWAFTEDSTTVKVEEIRKLFCFFCSLGTVLVLLLHTPVQSYVVKRP